MDGRKNKKNLMAEMLSRVYPCVCLDAFDDQDIAIILHLINYMKVCIHSTSIQ